MSEDNEPIAAEQENLAPLTHRRILTLMAIVAILSGLASFVLVSWQFGLGVLFGGILSFVNYYWLKFSLKKIFEKTAYGERPRFLAVRYTSRYLVLGGILLIVFLTKTVPVVSVILGLASFAFAIVIEGFIRLFSSFFNKKEI
jgi:hypothetical protein